PHLAPEAGWRRRYRARMRRPTRPPPSPAAGPQGRRRRRPWCSWCGVRIPGPLEGELNGGGGALAADQGEANLPVEGGVEGDLLQAVSGARLMQAPEHVGEAPDQVR